MFYKDFFGTLKRNTKTNSKIVQLNKRTKSSLFKTQTLEPITLWFDGITVVVLNEKSYWTYTIDRLDYSFQKKKKSNSQHVKLQQVQCFDDMLGPVVEYNHSISLTNLYIWLDNIYYFITGHWCSG